MARLQGGIGKKLEKKPKFKKDTKLRKPRWKKKNRFYPKGE